MISEWARQCIATYAAPCSATTSRICGSASPPETSWTSTAPASRAASATSWRIVSTETATPSAASARITGTTRSSSSAASGRVAPGRVDSPPMARRSAPCSCRSSAWAMAASVVSKSPPSEKESGVTLTTPMTRGRDKTGRPALHDSLPVIGGQSSGASHRGPVIDGGSSCGVDQGDRLGTRGGPVHDAPDGRGDRAGAGLAHATHRHAEVLGLDDHDHATGLEELDHRVGDLRGQAFLDLRALGVDVDQPGQLGEAGDLAVLVGDIAHVRHPGERHQVVLAHRPQLDVADQHHLVVADVEGGAEYVLRGLVKALRELGVRPGHAVGCVSQPFALGVLTDGDQQLAHGRSSAIVVELGDRSVTPSHRVDRHGLVGGLGGMGGFPASPGSPWTSPPEPGGVMMTALSRSSGTAPSAAATRIFSGISTGGMLEGLRSGEPVHAGRLERRRSGSKTSAICSLSRVSFSIRASTSESRTSRFSSRMSKASWCAVARSFLVSSSTIAATSSE